LGEGKKDAAKGRKKKNNRAPPGADRFPEFWAAYPKHVDKLDAEKAFAKALAHTDAEVLIAGAKRYAIERHGEPTKYTKQPATWLNKGSWTNEAPGAPTLDEDGNIIAVETPPPRNGRRRTPEEITEAYIARHGDAIIN
jgi:hypothetical protein